MTNLKFTIPSVQTVRCLGQDWPLDLAKVPAELRNDVIGNLVRQGLAIIGQRANAGVDKDEPLDKKISAVQADFDRILSGEYTFGAGGGGRKLTDEERELRSIVVGVLVQSGFIGKRAEAEKAVVKELDRTVVEFAKWKLARAGKAEADPFPVVDAWLAKWTEQALKAVAARKEASDLDMDLEIPSES